MNRHLSLADKITASIILVGILCIVLVYFISNSYRQLAYEHHEQSIQQLAKLEVRDLTDDLKTKSLDLALAIEHENDFKKSFRFNDTDDLTQKLNNQFNQYFVTAGVLKLLKLYVLDTDFTLLSISSEGITTDVDGQIICPQLSQLASSRKGSEQLQTLSYSCSYKNKPVFSVMVPFGGLSPKGYIQVVVDYSYSLQKIEQALAIPIQIQKINKDLLYQSKNWQEQPKNYNTLNFDIPIVNDDNDLIMSVTLQSDMTAFNEDIVSQRNWVMSLTFITTGLIIIIALYLLRNSSIAPLEKINNVLEKIHLHAHKDDEESRLLFEQLLDQIIKLRQKNKANFSVMILDLTHFKKVNEEHGHKTGDQLLIEVEKRLSTVLRGSDMISWVGTDTPGHKLMPSDTKTQYRATIARLGGDEFGLLLPSAETPEEASAVAQRIAQTLNKPFQVDNNTINIECKIGISIYPIHGEDENILIRNADKAMYQAKAFDKAAFVFDPEL